MILCTRPTRPKHHREIELLTNLRMAALVAKDNISQSPRVQVRSAELLAHLRKNYPSLEFRNQFMYQAGLLGDDLVLRVDYGMGIVTIRKVNADNVVSLHKICVSTISGGVQ